MQAGNVHLSALMAVMGLDMLMMAGEKRRFVPRLVGLLGPLSLAFPPTTLTRQQPNIVVQDVLMDLYEFRNLIAHGKEIPIKPFREKHDLRDMHGARMNARDYYYAQLMRDCGVFFLTRALRAIFVMGLSGQLSVESEWRQTLVLYEHRWKNSATVTGWQA